VISAVNANRLVELTVFRDQSRDTSYLSLAISSDDKWMAVGDNKGNITLLDLNKQSKEKTFKSFGRVENVAFSPDAALLASASWNSGAQNTTPQKSVALWDVKTGEKIIDLDYSKQVRSLRFSPDGAILATGSTSSGQNPETVVRLWDVKTGQEMQQFSDHTGSIDDLVFNAEGTQLVSASADGTLRIWYVASKEAVAVLKHTFPLPSGDLPMYGGWSGSGEFENGGKKYPFRLGFSVTDAGTEITSAFFSGGGLISIGGGAKITSKAFSWKITMQRDSVQIDGTFVSQTKAEGTLKSSIATGTWTAEPAPPGIRSVVFTSDGKHLICSASNGRLLLWDIESKTASIIATGSSVTESFESLALSKDKSIVLSVGRKVRAWTAENGEALFESGKDVAPGIFSPGGSKLVLTSDGKLALWVGSGGAIHFWGVPNLP